MTDTSISAEALTARLLSEDQIWLKDACRLFPPHRQGRSTHYSALLRWVLSGVKVGGRLVRLEAIHLPRGWLTSKQAVARFIVAQQTHLSSTADTTAHRPNQTQIEKELAARGL
jgi:hypothetical protein